MCVYIYTYALAVLNISGAISVVAFSVAAASSAVDPGILLVLVAGLPCLLRARRALRNDVAATMEAGCGKCAYTSM